MHGNHVTIVDVGRVVRIQNLIRYEANTGFSNAEKPVLKPNRKTGSSGFFHTGTQPYQCHMTMSPGRYSRMSFFFQNSEFIWNIRDLCQIWAHLTSGQLINVRVSLGSVSKGSA